MVRTMQVKRAIIGPTLKELSYSAGLLISWLGNSACFVIQKLVVLGPSAVGQQHRLGTERNWNGIHGWWPKRDRYSASPELVVLESHHFWPPLAWLVGPRSAALPNWKFWKVTTFPNLICAPVWNQRISIEAFTFAEFQLTLSITKCCNATKV